MARDQAPNSPRVKRPAANGGTAGSAAGTGPAASQASAAPLDSTEDLAALLGVTVEGVPVDTHDNSAVLSEGKLPLQAAEGFRPMHAADVPASLSSGSPSASCHSQLEGALAPVATTGGGADSPYTQGDTLVAAPDAAARGKFRSPRAGSAADTAAAFAGVNAQSGLNNTMQRRDTAAAAFDPVDTASQRAARHSGGASHSSVNTISDENNTSVSISKLVGMLKARTAAPNLGETFAGRGPAASWKPGAGLSGAAITGGLKNGATGKTSPAKKGSGGTSQRWNPGNVPLSTHNFDGAASSDDEPDVRPCPLCQHFFSNHSAIDCQYWPVHAVSYMTIFFMCAV